MGNSLIEGGPEARPAQRIGEFHEKLSVAQRRAAGDHAAQVHESWYGIAGRNVRMSLAGTDLAQVLPRALAHLSVPAFAAEPALVITAWDEAATGVPCPFRRTVLDDAAPGTTTVSADGQHVLFERANTVFSYDRARRHMVGWVSAANRLTQYERGRPLHSAFLLWQRDLGFQPVHAGFIERSGHGILLGGPGGSGKSTTSLVCMSDGWAYLADDYVAVERDDSRFVGYGLYCSTHLEQEHLKRFASLMPDASPPVLAGEDKSMVLLGDVKGSHLGGAAEISVLALPRIGTSEETTFRSASKTEALLRLAPSSLLLLPYQGIGHDGFAALVALVEGVPTYWLELGRDFRRLPVAVSAMLDHALQR